ncbi:MAG: TetM/TetW/TetO/TetS family tetracycline resistance ribosomal protection protein [Eubacteriales bacterium]|nr:TetM/TetW/TetO/TetS family tetracycline resistance ribosomal protection protein [Eubacteriales bacterium]
MRDQKNQTAGRRYCVGLLAHVDAGKTTLAESLLYLSSSISRVGRVDHGDAFLDTHEMERSRGITIFSKQAEFCYRDLQVSLLDTPGHVDFSAEMERTLGVLDAAILVISAADGVRGQDLTLWKLLAQYQIPTFLFINKMDQEGSDAERLLEEIHQKLSDNCVNFTETDTDTLFDSLAMCSERLMEEQLEEGSIRAESICSAVERREVFPCCFGSALKLQGVERLLEVLDDCLAPKTYPEEFSARVYKISRSEKGERLTHLKVTGGSLKVKQAIKTAQDEEPEKADQIRVYSGTGYQMVQEAKAGEICTVTGWQHSYAGQGLGAAKDAKTPVLSPVLTYRITLPEGVDVHPAYQKFTQLAEEDPMLHLLWEEETQEIRVQVMGDIQIEILQGLIRERFGWEVTFDSGNIVYLETIAAPVEGVGHFEPLRHYAEVHLLMEPLERGAGLVFDTDCSEDQLDKNWQRLILTHLVERAHRGVLTGAEITDMKITLKSGRAHQKHTEGGDFRQATYRAVRQGLRSAESLLLEPWFAFRMELPAECVGRAMSDVTRMHGVCDPLITEGETSVLIGKAPVSEMRDYHREVISYTRGRGHLYCSLHGYEVCHNAEQVIEAKGYDPEADPEHASASVFCAHGAGYLVPWDEVPKHMHLESCLQKKKEPQQTVREIHYAPGNISGDSWAGDKELEEIFTRTYGSGKEGRSGWGRSRFAGSYERRSESGAPRRVSAQEPVKEYLLVDGYNIIFAWEELAELAKTNMEGARGLLMDLLCNYQGYCKMTLICVFDAYKVEGGAEHSLQYHNIYVVYTKEAETADQYIEKTVHEIGKKYHVTVATSDLQEQRIIWGEGAARMSARELKEELGRVQHEIREQYLGQTGEKKNRLFENVPQELADYLENIRLGR